MFKLLYFSLLLGSINAVAQQSIARSPIICDRVMFYDTDGTLKDADKDGYGLRVELIGNDWILSILALDGGLISAVKNDVEVKVVPARDFASIYDWSKDDEARVKKDFIQQIKASTPEERRKLEITYGSVAELEAVDNFFLYVTSKYLKFKGDVSSIKWIKYVRVSSSIIPIAFFEGYTDSYAPLIQAPSIGLGGAGICVNSRH